MAKLGEPCGRVIGPIEPCLFHIELIEIVVDTLDVRLFIHQSLGLGSFRLGVSVRVQAERDPPNRLVFLQLDITSRQESGLTDGDLTRLLGDGDDGEADLANPRILWRKLSSYPSTFDASDDAP